MGAFIKSYKYNGINYDMTWAAGSRQPSQRPLEASLRPFDGIRVLANIGIMVRACVRNASILRALTVRTSTSTQSYSRTYVVPHDHLKQKNVPYVRTCT